MFEKEGVDTLDDLIKPLVVNQPNSLVHLTLFIPCPGFLRLKVFPTSVDQFWLEV